MKGEITKIMDNGKVVTFLIALDQGGYGRTYSSPQYRNWKKWKSLKVGSRVRDLAWKDQSKGILNADAIAIA